MQFEIEFNADHLDRIMTAVRQEIATPQEMLGAIGQELFRTNSKRHNAGNDPDGKPWQELSLATLAQGKRKGGPLKKTGRMLASFHYSVNGDDLVLGFDESRVQGKLPGIHHFGTERKGRHPGIPKRDLIGFPDADKKIVTDVTIDHLTRVLNRVR
ncbi:MAG: phage virion morphogenesis protein [Methylococcaceae bacterium]|nr:phage virion morphogenesis protein [Methylococcaceae bacterium]MDP2395017.1 phage virion morphogenesis protein [Methylococcaceae bacterium]MDP3020517.1 phage virion morphogenesis protein [Methylococcaceae bacterium]MDP3389709.1 phage virion morphogenesis protein [Methylococcaceae bacterium]MDP3932505.1 phage virion morphogenesis protein [Methylococcaceae bacterium]